VRRSSTSPSLTRQVRRQARTRHPGLVRDFIYCYTRRSSNVERMGGGNPSNIDKRGTSDRQPRALTDVVAQSKQTRTRTARPAKKAGTKRSLITNGGVQDVPQFTAKPSTNHTLASFRDTVKASALFDPAAVLMTQLMTQLFRSEPQSLAWGATKNVLTSSRSL
jgi:hypothetical protein